MANRNVKIWYDAEGDYLEVMFEQKEGHFRETSSDQVMEKVDADGNVLGFSVSRLRKVIVSIRWLLIPALLCFDSRSVEATMLWPPDS